MLQQEQEQEQHQQQVVAITTITCTHTWLSRVRVVYLLIYARVYICIEALSSIFNRKHMSVAIYI